MLHLKTRILLSVCGTLAITSASFAQAANEPAPAEPAAQNQQAEASDQSADAPPKNLGQKLGEGTKAQAEHSAEATAHKSLKDPNNQLGTSLQGRTRPVAGAGDASQNQTAMTAPSPDANQDANQQAAAAD